MRHHWITGAYEAINPGDGDDWVSFAYGPWPSQEAADAEADDRDKMMAALGTKSAADFEIDTTDELSYSQACKHFEETIMSSHFEELLPETHAAHLELMNRKAV
jgi:hypothetical protein